MIYKNRENLGLLIRFLCRISDELKFQNQNFEFERETILILHVLVGFKMNTKTIERLFFRLFGKMKKYSF